MIAASSGTQATPSGAGRDSAVVIVTYNSSDVIADCLRSVERSTGLGAEIIVVDNASRDTTASLVRSNFPLVRLVENEANRGFAAAANQGVALATRRLCVLLNPDTRVSSGAFEALAEAVRRNGDRALAGPRLVNTDGTLQRSAFRFPTPLVLLLEQLNFAGRVQWLNPAARNGRSGCASVDWLKGACLIGPTLLLQQFGPFDERFFMFSEDVDLCFRVRKAAVPVLYCPSAIVLHHGGMSTRHHARRMTLAFVDSTYLFYRKHWSYPRLLLASIALTGPALLKAVVAGARFFVASMAADRGEARRQRSLAGTFVSFAAHHPWAPRARRFARLFRSRQIAGDLSDVASNASRGLPGSRRRRRERRAPQRPS